jgi:hypothetical protein
VALVQDARQRTYRRILRGARDPDGAPVPDLGGRRQALC